MKLLRVRNAAAPRMSSGGSVLVEFAFIALAFYLLFAGTIELGRLITVSQAIQNAARVGARELALVALPPTSTFREALDNPVVQARIYDPRLLAMNVTGGEPNTALWPVVNRMLYPVMLRSRVGGQTFLHYPGAILQLPGGGYTVGVPQVVSRAANGTETIRWLPVVEEVRSDPDHPETGPFSLASTGPERGLVALRINCPYQATTMSAYKTQGVGPGTINTPIEAHDAGVSAENAPPDSGTAVSIEAAASGDPDGVADTGGFNVGPYGLGQMIVGNGPAVRPFRRVISAQSLFRREVFAQ